MTNVGEASAWLGYTYLFVRMLKNPMAYGIPWEELAMEPRLEARRHSLVQEAARKLEQVLPTGPLSGGLGTRVTGLAEDLGLGFRGCLR